MSGNGALIGMMRTITVRALIKTPEDQIQVAGMRCAVDVGGATVQEAYALRIGDMLTIMKAAGMWASGFVWQRGRFLTFLIFDNFN